MCGIVCYMNDIKIQCEYNIYEYHVYVVVTNDVQITEFRDEDFPTDWFSNPYTYRQYKDILQLLMETC